jgi:hypothetical protein
LFDLEKYGERFSKAADEKYYAAEREVNLVKAKMEQYEEGETTLEDKEGEIKAEKIALAEAEKIANEAEQAFNQATEKQKAKEAYEKLETSLQTLTARLPAMQALDGSRVIYMNTFSKTLAPSIRISYMVLPVALMEKLQRELGFYSCTVPSFEQHTLTRFLDEGYFEKHINRMRKFYKSRRNRLLAAVAACPRAQNLSILEEDAGLHFLVRVHSPMTDRELEDYCRGMGIRVRSLGSYYAGEVPAWAERCLVVNYSGLTDEQLVCLETLLMQMPVDA